MGKKTGEPWLYRLFVFVIVVLFVVVYFSTRHYGRVKQADYDDCKGNCMHIAAAVEAFAGDHEGNYPANLQDLVPAYLKSIPGCPVAGYDTYSETYVADNGSSPPQFTFFCRGDSHSYNYKTYYLLKTPFRIRRGKTDIPPDFPVYSSHGGLLSLPVADSEAIHRMISEDPRKINIRDRRGKTLLHEASGHGFVETVKLLLDNNANPNSLDGNLKTPLMEASAMGRAQVAAMLLERGAKTDLADNKYDTALHFASGRGHPPVIKILLDNGADINRPDDNGKTPLHRAVESGNPEAVNMLLSNDCDVNAQDRNDETPLHLASKKGDQIMVQGLIEHGAAVNNRNKSRQTPLGIAIENNDEDTSALLKQFGATR